MSESDNPAPAAPRRQAQMYTAGGNYDFNRWRTNKNMLYQYTRITVYQSTGITPTTN